MSVSSPASSRPIPPRRTTSCARCFRSRRRMRGGWLRKHAGRLSSRQVMIDKYLEGKLATLDEMPLEQKSPTLWEKMRAPFSHNKEPKPGVETLDKSPELIDTLWGFYFATGTYRPIARMLTLL